MKRWVLSIWILASCFCVSGQNPAEPADNRAKVDSSQYAVLYLYRPGGGFDQPGGRSYVVTADGVKIATVSYGKKQMVKIPPGIAVVISTTKKTKDPLTIDLGPGQRYYIRCSYYLGYFWGGPQLFLMPDQRGRFEYENYEEIIGAQREKERSDRKKARQTDSVYQ